MTRGRVTLDEFGPYDVMLHPGGWNGWGIPFFSFLEADRFLQDVRRAGLFSRAEYDPAQGFIFQAPEDEVPQIFQANEAGLYCLGGWSWTWNIEPSQA